MQSFIFDGAFGTYITGMTRELQYPEEAVLLLPDIVLKIHREYIESGAQAIKTDTFAANSLLIHDKDKLDRIIKEGWRLANKAAEQAEVEVRVFADIGPVNCENAADEYIALAEKFLKLGAHDFLFETQNGVEFGAACEYIKEKLPGEKSTVIASFAVGQDGYSSLGGYYLRLFEKAKAFGADVVGLNCICGPAHILEMLRAVPSGKYDLIMMPNSGYPSSANGRYVYNESADYFASKAAEARDIGVGIIGGCCGTTPEYIKKTVEKLDGMSVRREVYYAEPAKRKVVGHNFGKRTIAVEVAAPNTADASLSLLAAETAREAGADFITVPDSPLGKARANSLMTAAFLQRRAGIRAIPHICCRDKNQIALKGDLISANLEGINTVLAVTGDPVPKVSRGEVKNVFGFNSYSLIGMIASLNENLFTTNPYSICAALNINATDFSAELRRAEKKIAEGVFCFMTQPVYTDEHIKRLIQAKALGVKLLAGVMPPGSYKNALFMNNEIPGIEIPADVVQKLSECGDADETKEICIGCAKRTVERAEPICDGFYVITPLRKIDFTAEIVRYIRRNDR